MSKTPAYFAKRLHEFRRSLANIEALPQLSLLALVIGACTGLIIVVFRLAIETPFVFLDMAHAENFEALAPEARVFLILIGALIIGLVLRRLNKYQRQMSVGHVIDRLHNHQGNMPAVNWLAQLVLGAVAIITGQSVGREGPAVHLGAGAASQIGHWLRLPNNSMQTMIACGVAAAVSASFDTPLAGVIFAMEVIVMEYTIVGFVPVILSSVIGAAICKSILGEWVVFDVGDSDMNSLVELPFIVAAGFLIAVLAWMYIRLNLLAMRFAKMPVLVKALTAGALGAVVSIFVPEIMGLGYDTIQLTLADKIAIGALVVIAVAKLIVTPIIVGLGIPGGLIGPTLFIGACTGAILSFVAQALFPDLAINPGLYILLGMTGMMAAVINAPLAALVAVLELSHNPKIIFPAMLMIVVACLTVRVVFRARSIFIEQLAMSNRDIELGPATRALRNTSVFQIMDTRYIVTDEALNLEKAKYALSTQPQWIVFSFEEHLHALSAPDLAHFVDNAPDAIKTGETDIHLAEVPGRRFMMEPVLESASLYDAFIILRKTQKQMLYVSSNTYSHRSIHGLITIDAIKNHYQPKGIPGAVG